MLNEKILTIIKENIEKDIEVKLESHLLNDLEIDSFGMMMLINAFEDEFGFEIKENHFKDLKFVSDIINQLNLHFKEEN